MMEHFTYSVEPADCPFLRTDSTLEHWIGSAVKQGKLCRSENMIHKNALNHCNRREMLWLV